MVQNGYILNVSTADLPAFLQRVRSELKAVTREGVLIQVAKSAEMLYDMKFKDGGRPMNDDWENPVFSDSSDAVYYRPHMIKGVIDVKKYREGLKC